MNAGASPLLSIFEPKQRLEVPLFQRQYVWDREHQWEPLWEDIARKFGEFLEGRTDSPVHFLGAMVLDQKLTPTTHVVRRQVIDGQQRLTTLQLFLAAFRDFCSDNGYSELAQECKSYTMNSGMMADAKVDKFKVWPTTQDRPQFIDVMESGSRAEVERRHPLVRRKYQRRPDPRPRMIEAYIFFYDRIADFFVGDEETPPLAADTSLALRLEECFNALRNALHVVIIDLGEKDDPQVIFETLNARGQPLLPADLLRNYIFLRAARLGEDQESLYERYWSGFDDDFWRKEVRQGRLNRPRSDLFMQHFLASRLSTDISAKHLYVEYKHWIEKHQPFVSIEAELSALERQREDFRRVIAPKNTDILQPFAVFLETFEVSTVIPVLLSLLDKGTSEDELNRIATHIESYVLRRAVCAMTTKNYNRIFLTLNRHLHGGEMSAEALGRQLLSLKGESGLWPSDEAFREGWRTTNLYQAMNSSRIALVMRRISNSLLTSKTERIEVTSPLSVEHIMPQAWIEHWPLPNGSRGLTWEELWEPERDGETVERTRYRDSLIHTAGNLTVLSQPLNSSVSNREWPAKRNAILESSLLPINLSLAKEESWDEEAIRRRSDYLFEKAVTLWPRPSQ